MTVYFTEKELKDLLQFNKKYENFIAIPNNIFEILREDEELMEADAPHVAVAYSYVVLNTWLYRYAKYGVIDIDKLDAGIMQNILGYAHTYKKIKYITKGKRKNSIGVLERLRLLRTESYTEAPFSYHYCDDYGICPEFTYTDELFKDGIYPKGYNKNYKNKQIKYPVFALNERVIDDTEYNGTFFDIEHTHTVPFEAFIKCMTNPDLGCGAFYAYAYLYSRCGMNNGSIEVSIDTISARTGLNPYSRDKALDGLKKYHMIYCDAQDFVIDKGDLETKANTYTISNSNAWTYKPIDYKKREVISKETYEKNLEDDEALKKAFGG